MRDDDREDTRPDEMCEIEMHGDCIIIVSHA
jgi:hypothetical protein